MHVTEPGRDDPIDSRLRGDIRDLGTLLGESLVRHEGRDLLALVEEVRRLSRDDASAAAEQLTAVDVHTATRLARAFSVYFDLANVAEQVERSRDIVEARRTTGGPLRRVASAVCAADVPTDDVARLASAMAVRPVFTAHPTEAARRSVLMKLRRLADVMLDGELDDEQRQHRMAEVVDLLWQTDEIRLEPPTPVDEPRTALFCLDAIVADAVERHAARHP